MSCFTSKSLEASMEQCESRSDCFGLHDWGCDDAFWRACFIEPPPTTLGACTKLQKSDGFGI